MNTFIRIPKKVIAAQWYPFMKLNYVENVMGEVTEATASNYMGIPYNSNDPYQPPRKPKMTCIGGRVKCGDKVFDLEPSDYIVYDTETGFPIQVLNEATFMSAYTETSRLELCEECNKKVSTLNQGGSSPQSIPDCLALLERGEWLNLGNGKTIKTVAEFKKWCAENGKII